MQKEQGQDSRETLLARKCRRIHHLIFVNYNGDDVESLSEHQSACSIAQSTAEEQGRTAEIEMVKTDVALELQCSFTRIGKRRKWRERL